MTLLPLIDKAFKRNKNMEARRNECSTARAQTSLEYLIILGAALLVVIIFLTLIQNESTDVSRSKIRTEAMSAVRALNAAAHEVYSQGDGAKKQVQITIPESYEPEYSFVRDRGINIRALGSDYLETTEFDVHGNLPQASGLKDVWVISEGDRVLIGDAMIVLDKESLNVLLSKNSTTLNGFSVRSEWDSPISIQITKVWANDLVAISLSTQNIHLNPGEKEGVSVSFSAADEANGFYSGYIRVHATDGNRTETIDLPIMAEAIGYGTQVTPQLVAIPQRINVSMQKGTSVNVNIELCTNSQTSLASVDMKASDGIPGIWLNGNYFLGKIDADTCKSKMITISVPSGASEGTYSGSLDVLGNGSSGAHETIDMIVNVLPEIPDIIGPKLKNVTIYPKKPYTKEPIVIAAVADDSSHENVSGSSKIKECKIMLDNSGNWTVMNASDGGYDSVREGVNFKFNQGLGKGRHEVQMLCLDNMGNWGETETVEFVVMKAILFIKKDSALSQSETSWLNWISAQKSQENFAYDVDVFTANSAPVGSDLKYYSTIAFADWTLGTGQQTIANRFMGQGGTIILLGNAVIAGPKDLGLVNDLGNISEENEIRIMTNNSYITGPYTPVVFTIASEPIDMVSITNFGSGIALGALVRNGNPIGNFALGEEGRIAFFGIVSPNSLNENGTGIAIRVLDNALLGSTIAPATGGPG